MGVERDKVVKALSPPLPLDIVNGLLDEYVDIKRHLAFGHYRPSELTGARFAEVVVRLLQHLHTGSYTQIGTSLRPGTPDTLRSQIENNMEVHESLRFFIPRLVVVLLDVRNRRDVAHVGGDVNPNLSDSLFVAHTTDWIMTEILRVYYHCPINEAQQIANSLNETQIPIIADMDGFLRVQNTAMSFQHKILALLYHKHPDKVRDSDLCKWTEYKNSSRFNKDILGALHKEVLIHYDAGWCSLPPKGLMYIQKNIPMDLLV